MVEYTRVDARTLTRWQQLAHQVRNELTAAGLRVTTSLDQAFTREARGGAEIEIDSGGDAAGGVFVHWHPHSHLAEAAAESVHQNQLDSWQVRHSGTVSQAMRDAMLTILASAGFHASHSDDDMRPLALRIKAGPNDGRPDSRG